MLQEVFLPLLGSQLLLTCNGHLLLLEEARVLLWVHVDGWWTKAGGKPGCDGEWLVSRARPRLRLSEFTRIPPTGG